MHKRKINISHRALIVLISTSILFCYSLVKPLERKSPEAKEIKLELSFPNLRKKYKDGCHDSSLLAKILIINHTDSVTSFFEDWNSWGYFNIRFQIRTGNSLYEIEKIDRDWDKNFPSYKALFPGDTMILTYNLTRTKCQQVPFTGMIPEPGIRMKGITAVYQAAFQIPENFERDTIKYKFEWKPLAYSNRRAMRYDKNWVITDSIKVPKPLSWTFPLEKLVSNEFVF